MNLTPEKKIAGILAPLFALRSKEDLGIGDVTALREFVDWADKLGFKLVQLLPINETGADNSPYMAVSSIALDPVSLDVSPAALKDLSLEDFNAVMTRVDMAALREGPVKYRVVKALKLELLQRAFDSFEQLPNTDARAQAFAAFAAENADWLDAYAFFRTLMQENASEKWDDWPKAQQSLKAAQRWITRVGETRRAAIERRMEFFKYVQWVAFSQWRALKAYCDSKGVALMGDVPFGLSYYSADVWAGSPIFDLKWSGGAPPEPLFQDDPFTCKWGQNWGVPLYKWPTMRREKFAWWRRRVRTVREFFHLFRIDHVLGFYRMYAFPWRPQQNGEFLPLSPEEAKTRTGGRLPHFIERDDSTPVNQKKNQKRGEELLSVLLQEVGEHRLIGEDLGVVPPYVRPSLTSLGIAGFKIPQWEREPDGSLTPYDQYQRLSVTTYGTHDHEPLRAMWERWWGKFMANERGEQNAAHPAWVAGEEMRRLMRYARIYEDQPLYTDYAHEALIAALLNSESWIAIFMITDLLGFNERFNVPGAIAESNWSERLGATPAEWMNGPEISAKLKRIQELVVKSGRG